MSKTTSTTEATTCTNLAEATKGQYVQLWRAQTIVGFAQIDRGLGNGTRLEVAGHLYIPERDGKHAFRPSKISGYGVCYVRPFAPGETVADAEALIAAERAEAERSRQEAEARKAAELARRIQTARIEHRLSFELPGARLAKWVDGYGNIRTTVYTAKARGEGAERIWFVSISDLNTDGTFASSSAAGDECLGLEEVVNEWIARNW